MSCRVFVTLDLDWASDEVIEETLKWFEQEKIPVTIFATHESKPVKQRMSNLEVGLHPYFHPDSSQGSTPNETIETLSKISWNIPVYRSHRFLDSNPIREWMKKMGMKASSNVCTDLNPVPPFIHRSGMLEIPIAFEDGSYLERGHRLSDCNDLLRLVSDCEIFVMVLHPMHFILNTPYYQWMREVKDRISREHWNQLTLEETEEMRYADWGIASFVQEFIKSIQLEGHRFEQLGSLFMDL